MRGKSVWAKLVYMVSRAAGCRTYQNLYSARSTWPSERGIEGCFPGDFFLLLTQNIGLKDTRVPSHRTPVLTKPTWSQVELHSLWEQLLLAPLLVLRGLSEASGVHDVIGCTALRQQLYPRVTANGVGLPWPGEVLGGESRRRRRKRGGPRCGCCVRLTCKVT